MAAGGFLLGVAVMVGDGLVAGCIGGAGGWQWTELQRQRCETDGWTRHMRS